jgi:hypothetical protein
MLVLLCNFVQLIIYLAIPTMVGIAKYELNKICIFNINLATPTMVGIAK